MKTHFRSIAELQQEIIRLESEKVVIEKRLKNHFKNVGETFHPAHFIKSAFKSLISDKEVTDTVKSKTAEAAIGLLVSQLILRNSNPLIKAVGGVMGTTMASSVFGDTATYFIDKIKVLYRKYREKHKENGSGETNVDDTST